MSRGPGAVCWRGCGLPLTCSVPEGLPGPGGFSLETSQGCPCLPPQVSLGFVLGQSATPSLFLLPAPRRHLAIPSAVHTSARQAGGGEQVECASGSAVRLGQELPQRAALASSGICARQHLARQREHRQRSAGPGQACLFPKARVSTAAHACVGSCWKTRVRSCFPFVL